ncbi:MAG: hypothetical protein KZQ96_02000 [Candidatus Thiodiazotropha sp. (ex Lucinoma borealis)]|nr:hypothetical protein [Candidatus Thiodiazotropha sp. (ex Lucinoma borealis)]
MQALQKTHPCPIPVTKWNDHYDWPPIGGLRHIIFNTNTNGFAPAIMRVGRRVLIDPEKFWEVVEEQNNREGAA